MEMVQEIVPTGISGLDFHKGDFVILASRPGIGRTSLALSLSAELAVKSEIPVGYISCGELDAKSIQRKLLSQIAEVPLLKIRTEKLSDAEKEKIKRAEQKLASAPLFIDDAPNVFYEEIACIAQRMQTDQKIQMLFIDEFAFIGEMVSIFADADIYSDCVSEYTAQNLRSELEFTLDELKSLAERLHIAVVLLASLPRAAEECEPSLKSFGRFLALQRKADMILLLHREYTNDFCETAHTCKITVAKNNYGKTGDILGRFIVPVAKFEFPTEEQMQR